MITKSPQVDPKTAERDRHFPTKITTSFMGDFLNVVRGLLMGGADIIPGVSGGTVALILGIYQRLVTAISHFDLTFIGHVRSQRWREAARHVDLRFLCALGCGILSGIVALASLMHYLITTDATRPLTLAAFFGLILASGVLVGRMVERWSFNAVALCVAGAGFAFWITGLKPTPGEPTTAFIFLCGMIGICAMILPGISGAFILLLLGVYVHVTDAIKSIKGITSGAFTWDHAETIVVFGIGCCIGLLAFSKILRWLLQRHESMTMALLCGFMVGSLRKIWPFQRDLTPEVEKFKLKIFENAGPESTGQLLIVITIIVVAMVFVFALDWLSRGSAHVPPLPEENA